MGLASPYEKSWILHQVPYVQTVCINMNNKYKQYCTWIGASLQYEKSWITYQIYPLQLHVSIFCHKIYNISVRDNIHDLSGDTYCYAII